MAPMKIIGISGRARSGKDTLASMILTNARAGARMSFAEPIRRFVAEITGLNYADLIDGLDKEVPIPEFGGKSPRQMMQTLGTEWGRNLIDPNLWITVARGRLNALASHPPPGRPDVVVFSDVRFDNEAAMLRDAGGTIIRLDRPGALSVSPHASENGLAPCPLDVEFLNDGDLQKLSRFAQLVVGRN